MNLESLLALILLVVFCCYLVYRWQQAVVDRAIPPAPEPYPVPMDMTEQWVAATQADKGEPTLINPQAAWPFPHSKP